MGREISHDLSHDPTIFHHSSIALLQERFRQLQRVKEMREERELQKKLINETKQFNFNFNSNGTTRTYNNESTRLFSHPELIIPSSRSPPHVSLSLWPTSQGKEEENNTRVQTPSLRDHFSHTQSMQVSWNNNVYDYDSASDSGVDTSLHL